MASGERLAAFLRPRWPEERRISGERRQRRDDHAREKVFHHVSLIPSTGKSGIPVMNPRCVKLVL